MDNPVRKFGGAQENAGAPAYEPTKESRDRVMGLATAGLPQRFIASRLQISQPTLLKYYRVELDIGMARRYELPCIKLWEAVAAGEPWAINKVLGEVPEFRPTFRVEHTGANGGPIETKNLPTDPVEAARTYMEFMKHGAIDLGPDTVQ